MTDIKLRILKERKVNTLPKKIKSCSVAWVGSAWGKNGSAPPTFSKFSTIFSPKSSLPIFNRINIFYLSAICCFHFEFCAPKMLCPGRPPLAPSCYATDCARPKTLTPETTKRKFNTIKCSLVRD